MNELSQAMRQLPDNLEDLSKFVLIGREKLNAVRAEIRAIKAVELAAEVHEQKLAEAQDIAEAVLDAEAKLGELTSRMETAQGRRTDIEHSNSGVTKSKQLEQIGLSKMDASRYENLAAHPEIVEQAKAEARANGEIVTRQTVINKIASECYPNKYQQAAREFREAKKRNEEFEEQKAEGVVSLADAKQNKDDREKIFESFLNSFNDMHSQIRHFKLMADNDDFGRTLSYGDKYAIRDILTKLGNDLRIIMRLQRIAAEVNDEE